MNCTIAHDDESAPTTTMPRAAHSLIRKRIMLKPTGMMASTYIFLICGRWRAAGGASSIDRTVQSMYNANGTQSGGRSNRVRGGTTKETRYAASATPNRI